MKIVISQNRARAAQKSPIQKRFERLSRKLLELRRHNQDFERELNELVGLYSDYSRQQDEAQLDTLKALAQKLIVFASRKSLADWHRDELGHWLGQLVSKIAAFDRQAAAALDLDYQAALAKSMDMTLEEMQQELHYALSDFEAFFDTNPNQAEADWDETEDDEGLQDDLFGFDGLHKDTDPPWADAWEDDPAQQEEDRFEPAHRQDKNPMDSDWVKQLFRKAAQALHPDREQDEDKRAIKQQQMTQLLKARKQGDLMTLLSIYSEHIDERGIEIAEQEMAQICALLEEQIEELAFERATYACTHPVRYQVYQTLYASDAESRQEKIEDWKQALAEQAQAEARLLDSLKNLSQLRQALRERQQQRYYADPSLFGF
ncbi:MAG: hypothetical protein H7842_00555 [Gammaproteobacteria bacterium SHHR-1]|uniref:hypothetical protein n=1 Tax=Magnetovirga frankeli TaxID=947516 RepID=UPI001292E07F|nr:hypothetical protein D5125_16800 [gamma proteobacterium SS-5]